MRNYIVTWTIDIEAESPEQAARQALTIQRDPRSIATVFECYDTSTEESTLIDLEEAKP